MRMMNKIELKEKIAKAMERAKVTCDTCISSENRQIFETGLKAAARADTLFGILEALNGRAIYLNILAGE